MRFFSPMRVVITHDNENCHAYGHELSSPMAFDPELLELPSNGGVMSSGIAIAWNMTLIELMVMIDTCHYDSPNPEWLIGALGSPLDFLIADCYVCDIMLYEASAIRAMEGAKGQGWPLVILGSNDDDPYYPEACVCALEAIKRNGSSITLENIHETATGQLRALMALGVITVLVRAR